MDNKRKFKAVRNIKLCTKDCLCLYVCPTGATDTENGQIDFEKCTGCGICVNACPSKALSLVPYKFPKEQEKNIEVSNIMRNFGRDIIESKNNYETKMNKNAESSKLFKALKYSSELMAEDIYREAGYLLPQGNQVIELLNELKKTNNKELKKIDIDGLIKNLKKSQLKKDL